MSVTEMTREQWMAKGKELFGEDFKDWRFVCPVCKAVQTARDFMEKTSLEKGKITSVLGFSCVGRWTGAGTGFSKKAEGPPGRLGCDYAGGGLFKLNPVHVTWNDEVHQVFEFDA